MTIVTAPQPVGSMDARHAPLDNTRWGDLYRTACGVPDLTQLASWQVTASGSDRTVTVGAIGNDIVALGHLAQLTATETVDLSTIGSQPVAGQERYSLIMARLDRTAHVVAVHTEAGTPATVGTAAKPTATSSATVHDVPLAMVRQEGAAAIPQSDVADLRPWLGGAVAELQVANNYSIGSTFGQFVTVPLERSADGTTPVADGDVIAPGFTVYGRGMRAATAGPGGRLRVTAYGSWDVGSGESTGARVIAIDQKITDASSPSGAVRTPEIFDDRRVNASRVALVGYPLDVQPGDGIYLQIYVTAAATETGQRPRLIVERDPA